MNLYQLAFGIPGGWEWIVIGIIALLIFGRRLPEVARALGNSIVQFKRGIADVQNEIDDASNSASRTYSAPASTQHRNPLDGVPEENKVKPLQPFDERLGGDQEELKRLNQQGSAAPQQPQQQQHAQPSQAPAEGTA